MGIKVEFNPDLALRNIREFQNGNRKIEECIPENMKEGVIYPFLKSGQRNYWLDGEVPLLETSGGEKLSRPRASILILKAVHSKEAGAVVTRGEYRVMKVIMDDDVYFESYKRIK